MKKGEVLLSSHLDNDYIHIKELEKELGKTRQTIYRQLKEKNIQPVNPDTFRSDGGYTYRRADIESLLHAQHIPMTLQEAADYIGITPQYLSLLRKQGDIEAKEVLYGKQKRLAFTQEACDRLMTTRKAFLENHPTLRPYGNGYRLFQIIESENKKGRVVQTTPTKVLWNNGEVSFLKQSGAEVNWIKRPYVRQKGFAIFHFPIPRSPFHPVYDLLYRMMEEIGTNNITIAENTEGDYEVKVRNSRWSGTDEDMTRLQSALMKGNVTKEEDSLVIHSDEHPITVYFRQEELEAFQRLKREEETIGEYIARMLRKNLEQT